MTEVERAEALKAIQLELFELKRDYAARRKALTHRLILIQGGGQKRCRKCREVMNVDQFYKDTRYSDGHYPYCRECKLAQVKRKGNVKAGVAA